ncbi:CGNR zinc finger domain-containing protein [Kordiimonas sp.]|uniref:CGNR zinc finger domain-containing protein n=1 Tax=Kordiimonas sp. TaxID=1970157 RepID=UPI003A957A6E
MTRRKFETCSGAPCLDLVDTVADRSGCATELLAGAADLDKWFGVVFGDLGLDVLSSSADLQAATELREAIYCGASARLKGEVPAADDTAIINRFAQLPQPVPQLVEGKVVYTAISVVQSFFSLLATDAIRCLSHNNMARLRSCPECRMIFFDNSRPGRRVWCSSAKGCGNRAKVRRHRARKAE